MKKRTTPPPPEQVLVVRLPLDLYLQLDALCQKLNVTKKAFTIQAIEQLFARIETSDDFPVLIRAIRAHNNEQNQ
jgi:predicted DNA-binding protein